MYPSSAKIMINDTISDMLTRIRNANLIKNENVFVLNTKTNQRIGELLKKQGYIESIQKLRLEQAKAKILSISTSFSMSCFYDLIFPIVESTFRNKLAVAL